MNLGLNALIGAREKNLKKNEISWHKTPGRDVKDSKKPAVTRLFPIWARLFKDWAIKGISTESKMAF